MSGETAAATAGITGSGANAFTQPPGAATGKTAGAKVQLDSQPQPGEASIRWAASSSNGVPGSPTGASSASAFTSSGNSSAQATDTGPPKENPASTTSRAPAA